ncbi:MAG: hypothetical protein K0U52_11170 [Gammaproteobacteria bacterium]|nr:hypothetical protein [Gammaproteobacteria bacterium]
MKNRIKKILKEENISLNEQSFGDKELVKNELVNTITSEIISTLDYTDRMGFDGTLNYDDLTEILEEVFRNTDYLFREE